MGALVVCFAEARELVHRLLFGAVVVEGSLSQQAVSLDRVRTFISPRGFPWIESSRCQK